MIVKLPGDIIRDKLVATMTFIYDRKASHEWSMQDLANGEHYVGGLAKPKFEPFSMHLPYQTFVVEGIDTFLRTRYPEEFGRTTIRLKIGEKEDFVSSVLGEDVNGLHYSTFFRHTEYAHRKKGDSVLLKINPLQDFRLTLDHLNQGIEGWFQIVLVGYILNPVA